MAVKGRLPILSIGLDKEKLIIDSSPLKTSTLASDLDPTSQATPANIDSASLATQSGGVESVLEAVGGAVGYAGA